MGIEPTTIAWEATILPLNYTCAYYTYIIRKTQVFVNNAKIDFLKVKKNYAEFVMQVLLKRLT